MAQQRQTHPQRDVSRLDQLGRLLAPWFGGLLALTIVLLVLPGPATPITGLLIISGATSAVVLIGAAVGQRLYRGALDERQSA